MNDEMTNGGEKEKKKKRKKDVSRCRDIGNGGQPHFND